MMPNWLQNFLYKAKLDIPFTGLILPSQEELEAIPKQSEIVASAAAIDWKPLDLTKLPKYPQYDQLSKSSCVANTSALIDTILYAQRNPQKIKNDLKFSADFIYENRVNKPSEGMIGTDSFKIRKAKGSIPYDILPNGLTEAEIINIEPWYYDVAKVFQTADEPILLPLRSIDSLVSTQIATGKPIMTWFDFNWNEWVRKVPFVSGLKPALRHSVTFIPSKEPGTMTYGIYEGEKAIVIQDSTAVGSGIDGKRIIKESFFMAHNIFNAYTRRFKFDANGPQQQYDGVTIISLQKCLQSVGYFPLDIVFVENLGPTTRKALAAWKRDNGLPFDSVLDAQTKALLHAKF